MAICMENKTSTLMIKEKSKHRGHMLVEVIVLKDAMNITTV